MLETLTLRLLILFTFDLCICLENNDYKKSVYMNGAIRSHPAILFSLYEQPNDHLTNSLISCQHWPIFREEIMWRSQVCRRRTQKTSKPHYLTESRFTDSQTVKRITKIGYEPAVRQANQSLLLHLKHKNLCGDSDRSIVIGRAT